MSFMFGYVKWDPSPAVFDWNLPLLDRPILWYGFFFALGFFLAYFVFRSLLTTFLKSYRVGKKEVLKIAEKVCLYVVVGAIVGARLGDVLFYQDLSVYRNDFFGVFRFWEGGLSSHGGVMGILISLWIYCRVYRKKYQMLSWVTMLDLLSIPALLAGGFIRLGNFFNQEIVGKVTTFPLGVIFGHPADGGPIAPRHPVQLYEAVFYFAFFIILWSLRKNIPKMFRIGKTAGLFFMGMFSFRFVVEYVKSPQSVFISNESLLNMGQWLSIPMFLFGVFLFFREKKSLRPRSVKRH